jgi:hypothetical protein
MHTAKLILICRTILPILTAVAAHTASDPQVHRTRILTATALFALRRLFDPVMLSAVSRPLPWETGASGPVPTADGHRFGVICGCI